MKRTICTILSALLVLSLSLMPASAQEAGVPAPVSGNPPAAAAITVDGLAQLLASCTGYEGTAGVSLKGAVKAQQVLDYCLSNQLAQTDRAAFAQLIAAAYGTLSEEQQQEITGNMEYIFDVLDAAFADYLSVEDLLDAAGVKESIRPLLTAENACAHYSAFKMTVLQQFGVFETLLAAGTGYAGTAGSSMKNAIAACEVLKFCTGYGTAWANPDELNQALSAAYGALSAEQTPELAWNMESIIELVETAFVDYESMEGLLDSAGIAQDMKLLLEKKGAYADWAVFSVQMQRVLNVTEE